MRLLLLPALALLLAPAAQAQVVWQTEVPGIGVTELLQRPDGSLVVVGDAREPSNTNTFVDISVSAFSEDGDALWTSYVSTDGIEAQDFAYDAAVDADGNVYVVGSTNQGERFHEQGIVVKVATDGSELWRYEFGEPGAVEDIAYDVRIDSDGDLIVVGTTNGPQDDVFSVFRIASADGSLVWRSDYDSSTLGNAVYGGMTLTPGGKVIQHGAAYVQNVAGSARRMPSVAVFSVADGALETSAVFETDQDLTDLQSYEPDDCAAAGESLWCIGASFNAFFGSIDPDASYRLRRYDADGTQAVDLTVLPDSAWVIQSNTAKVAVDGQGRVWITGEGSVPSQQERERMLIVYEDEAFRLVDRAPLSGPGVAGLAVDEDGFVWLSYQPLGDDGLATDVQRVEQFAPSGQKLWHYDLPESTTDTNVALLPAGQERVYAAYNRRVPPGGIVGDRHSIALLDPAQTTSTEAPSASDLAVLRAMAPNPVHSTTNVAFDLGAPSHVTLVAYDLLGRRVATLVEGTLPAGSHARTLEVASLAPGMYLLRLTHSGGAQTRALTVVR